jgi:transglutaminase-like putative cysteine protease
VRTLPRVLYLLCFIGLAATAALALNRGVQPSMSGIFLRTVLAACLAGAPGLCHRKAWPAALVLLPLGAYLVVRTTLPLPGQVDGLNDHLSFYIGQLRIGATAYAKDIFPLDVAAVPGLRLLVAFSAYLLVGVAAFLALSLRRVISGLILLMVLLGFSLTVDTIARTLWPVALFLILAGCLLVLSRGLNRTGWRLRSILAGGGLGMVAVLLALVLINVVPSTAAPPWKDWRTWDPFFQSNSTHTFNWMQNYPQMLDPAADHQIMRVTSPTPSYWRANTLDVFTGSTWVTSQTFTQRPPVRQTAGAWIYTIPAADPGPPGKTVTEVFQVQSAYTNYFFTGGEPHELYTDHRVKLRMSDARSLHSGTALGPAFEYTLKAVIPTLGPRDLVGKGTAYPRDVAPYLALPFPHADEIDDPHPDAAWRRLAPIDSAPQGWEWANLYAINARIVGNAADPYEVALRIEQYLRERYTYSLRPPASDYSSPYAAFLFDTQTGYCQHFAGSMALLLRYNAIPAQVAVGFTSGDEVSEGVYAVSANNAHAWVEAFFPTVGWATFDPTPGRNIPTPSPSSASPGFVDPFSEDATGSDVTETPQPRADSSIDDVSQSKAEEAAGDATDQHGPTRPLWLLSLPILAIVWPTGRSLWRRRHLRRGPPDMRLAASLQLLRHDLSAYGLPTSPADTIEDTLRLAEEHLHVVAAPGFTDRVHAVLFGARKAGPEDLMAAEAFRRRVKVELHRRHGWMRTVLTWYGLARPTPAEGTNA